MNWLIENWWQVALVVLGVLIWLNVRQVRQDLEYLTNARFQEGLARWKARRQEGLESGDDLIPPGAEQHFKSKPAAD